VFVSALGLVHVARDVTDLSRRVKVRERDFFCAFPNLGRNETGSNSFAYGLHPIAEKIRF
jgi:hypothetical protein